MPGSGVCTSCGAEAELNDKDECQDCAGGSMEPEEGADDSANASGGDEEDSM